MPRENDAFSLYATESPYTVRSLRGKLMKRIGEYGAEIATGASPDWAHYRQRVGIVMGLKEALEILEEVQEEGK
jgi:hypothetical protein